MIPLHNDQRLPVLRGQVDGAIILVFLVLKGRYEDH